MVTAGVGINQFMGAQVKRAEEAADSIVAMESTLITDIERIDPVVREWIAVENNPRLWATVNHLVAEFYNVTRVTAQVTLNYKEAIPGDDRLAMRDFVIPFIELRGKDQRRLGYILNEDQVRWQESLPPQVNGNQITYNMTASATTPRPISEFKIYSLLFRGKNDTAQRNQERHANRLLESGTLDVFVNGIQLISEPFGAIRLESVGGAIAASHLLENPLIDPAGAFEEAIMSAAAEKAEAL